MPELAREVVPDTLDGVPLAVAERSNGGWLALYRGDLPAPGGAEDANPPHRAARFGASGDTLWTLDLDRFLSSPTHLEVADLRLRSGPGGADPTLYFNEACQSYAAEADGACSSLLAVRPRTGQLVWRTRPLVSNNVFILEDGVAITGYGFTAEPDHLFLVDLRDGSLLDSLAIDSAHRYLEVRQDTLWTLTTSRAWRVELR